MFLLWITATLIATAVAIPLILLGLWHGRRRASRWHCPSCGSVYGMKAIAGEFLALGGREGGGFIMRCVHCNEERRFLYSGRPDESGSGELATPEEEREP